MCFQCPISQINLGNGTSETYLYNDRFQMIGQELKKGSDVLQRYDYGYGQIDPATGNLETTKNNGQLSLIESWIGTSKQATQKFKYDHIGRLKESAEYRGDNGALTYKQVFDFDRFGNLYRKAGGAIRQQVSRIRLHSRQLRRRQLPEQATSTRQRTSSGYRPEQPMTTLGTFTPAQTTFNQTAGGTGRNRARSHAAFDF